MSGRGSKRKKSTASSQKAKKPRSSKRPKAVVKSAVAAPRERPGDCVHGPADVDSFPAMMEAVKGIYIGTAIAYKDIHHYLNSLLFVLSSSVHQCS
jgi:hypothetical protein